MYTTFPQYTHQLWAAGFLQSLAIVMRTIINMGVQMALLHSGAHFQVYAKEWHCWIV
jgi:hypothetical protein